MRLYEYYELDQVKLLDTAQTLKMEEEKTDQAISFLLEKGIIREDLSLALPSLFFIPTTFGIDPARSLTFELMGPPGSFKTTTSQHILNRYKIPAGDYVPELTNVYRKLADNAAFVELVIKQFGNTRMPVGEIISIVENINLFYDSDSYTKQPKEDWEYLMSLEMFKHFGMWEIERRAMAMENGSQHPGLILAERGPHDRIAFLRALNMAGKTSFLTDEMVNPSILYSRKSGFYKERSGRDLLLVAMYCTPKKSEERKPKSGIVREDFLNTLYKQYLRFVAEFIMLGKEPPFAFCLLNCDSDDLGAIHNDLDQIMDKVIDTSNLHASIKSFQEAKRLRMLSSCLIDHAILSKYQGEENTIK